MKILLLVGGVCFITGILLGAFIMCILNSHITDIDLYRQDGE